MPPSRRSGERHPDTLATLRDFNPLVHCCKQALVHASLETSHDDFSASSPLGRVSVPTSERTIETTMHQALHYVSHNLVLVIVSCDSGPPRVPTDVENNVRHVIGVLEKNPLLVLSPLVHEFPTLKRFGESSV